MIKKITSLFPKWNDPEKGQSYRKALRKYALAGGFSDAEITEFGKDPRIVLMVAKALLFDRATSEGNK